MKGLPDERLLGLIEYGLLYGFFEAVEILKTDSGQLTVNPPSQGSSRGDRHAR